MHPYEILTFNFCFTDTILRKKKNNKSLTKSLFHSGLNEIELQCGEKWILHFKFLDVFETL